MSHLCPTLISKDHVTLGENNVSGGGRRNARPDPISSDTKVKCIDGLEATRVGLIDNTQQPLHGILQEHWPDSLALSRRPCPVCDSSVYPYCSEKLLHDACCCLDPYDTPLPYQCNYADCSFLHANSCLDHKLITRCCCNRAYFFLKRKLVGGLIRLAPRSNAPITKHNSHQPISFPNKHHDTPPSSVVLPCLLLTRLKDVDLLARASVLLATLANSLSTSVVEVATNDGAIFSAEPSLEEGRGQRICGEECCTVSSDAIADSSSECPGAPAPDSCQPVQPDGITSHDITKKRIRTDMAQGGTLAGIHCQSTVDSRQLPFHSIVTAQLSLSSSLVASDQVRGFYYKEKLTLFLHQESYQPLSPLFEIGIRDVRQDSEEAHEERWKSSAQHGPHNREPLTPSPHL
ncbi:hypothetical protein J437_LFUL017169 [Ladona fulva]|uniref:Uncharacterized protein n=1 Tax=Ladona fulva TaxID=123851 RepID=A0A8K0KP70_LADFU|nr:hypothetical protein J437_LFUL017169 [Ladona fulva]